MFHRDNEKKVKTERGKSENPEKSETKTSEKSKTNPKEGERTHKPKEGERTHKPKEGERSKVNPKEEKKVTIKEEKKEIKKEVEKKEEKKEVKKDEKKEVKKDKTVIQVKSLEEYERLKSDGLVVIDYYTEWCGPCKNFAPTFEKLAKNYTGVTFLSVDAEKLNHPDCETINKVPSFKIFLNGNLKREFTGADEEKLAKYIERYEIQILVYGKVQKSFDPKLKSYISEYMDMLTPDV